MLGRKVIGFVSRSSPIFYATTRSIKMRALQTFGKPEYDIKLLIDNYDVLKETIFAKHLHKGTLIKDLNYIRDNYGIVSEMGKEVGSLKKDRDAIAKELMDCKGRGLAEGDSELESVKARLRELKKRIHKLEKQRTDIVTKFTKVADSFPVLIDSSVPLDKTEEVVHLINCDDIAQVEESSDKHALSHKFIGQDLGILDLEVASRVSGHAFYYLIGDGALLEQALVQYALAKARSKGYTMCIPPTIVRQEVVEACGFRPRDKGEENQIYLLGKDDLSLTATAEISLAALESKKTFSNVEETLPKKYVGVARSYRSEAGARGATTSGIYRVHEFTKVELFHFTRPETAWEELEALKDFQIEIITELGLKAKVLNMPASDLGFPAAKKYDIEAWMPGRKTWGEVTSSSYCRDYQARRMNIKYRDPVKNNNGLLYVHTLNGTAMAVPRVIVAIIENNWDPETESILIPEVLRPYMDGRERIYKQK